MKKACLPALFTLLPMLSWAQESQTAFDFLRLPVSAHAAALGGDNVTIIEDDASLPTHNPALLSSVSSKTIHLGFMTYMQGAKMGSAAFNNNVGNRISWAVSAQYMDYGSMKETDENNVQTGTFSARDIAVAGHFAYMLGDRWAGGVTARFVASYIGNYNSTAVGVDLGINYYDPEREWSLSAVAKNLGGQLSAYNDEYEKMPIDLQVGVSKRFEHVPVRLSATFVNLNHWHTGLINHAVVGAELLLSDNIWLGAGYNFRRADEMKIDSGTEDGESSHGAGWSFGAGLNLQRFHVNVAYGKYHVSSSSLMVNLAYTL